MQNRILGRQGLTVSSIGYGAMGFHLAYGSSDASEAANVIRAAHDAGVTLFDTAESYGWGENEKVVGRAIAPFRDEVVVATKFGWTREWGLDSRPEHIREVADNSLRNLGVEYLDVLYQHRPDPNVPVEDVAGAVKGLVDAGKVRYFGLSEAGPRTIRRAHAVQPVSVLQSEYSLFERDVESLFPTLEELGIGFVAYSPLGRGFLTGTARPAGEYEDSDMRNNDERWQPGNFERNQNATAELSRLADSRGATVAQLALAWILAQRDYIVAIPGSRSPDRAVANARAADLELTPDDLQRIAEILPAGGFGARYPGGMAPSWD